ncbi:MAG: pitrilysin family protein [Planctomycetota bacterium]
MTQSMHRARAHFRQPSAAAPVSMAGAEVQERRLANGLRVLIAERKGAPAVASLLFYRVGARNETEREAGVSHFLEHMMFKGSKNYGKGEVDRLTTQLGGQNNAFTGYDHTAYWFQFAPDRWLQALDLERDRIAHLAIDPAEFASERAVVLEELAMGVDDPWRALSYRVEEALVPRHPYGRPIIGYPDTLLAMSPEDMRAYYDRFYHVSNATLVVAGDVRPATVMREVKARFGDLAAGPDFAAVDPPRAPLSAPSGPLRLEMPWDDAGKRLVMAWQTAPVATDADYALDLVQTAMTSGRNARLVRKLVLDDGLATTISMHNDTRVEGGFFWIFAECAQGVEPDVLERAIDAELETLATKPLSAAELKRAKAMIASSEAYEAETVTDLAESLGEWAVDDDWRRAFDGGARHARVTAKEVRDVVRRYLAPERRALGWCLPGDRS